MTNHWADIQNSDLILIMGGNAAEAHPCGFKWVIEAKKRRGARLIVVDPRFTRSAAMADLYAPLRTGTDIAFLGGVINQLLSRNLFQHDYVAAYTNAAFLIDPRYGFDEGLFSGYDASKRTYDPSSWVYQLDDDGFAKLDPSMNDPQCVLQLLRRHYARYTPEMVSRVCGTPVDAFMNVANAIAETAAPSRVMTVMYALGWTQHTQGTQMVRCAAMLQTLLGNIGMPGGGMNALRGHSNIQGLTDLGLLSNLLPGYLTLPGDAEQDYQRFIEKRTLKPLRPDQMNYWQHYQVFHVSLMKAWWGDAARAQNNWAYDYLPKLDKSYDVLLTFEMMAQGRINGYICQGFNPLAAIPDKAKVSQGLAKLKYLVVIDPLATETSEFWSNFGVYHDVDPALIQTEVFRLPSTCFAEEDGSLTNSGRWLQWHWKAADPPGEAMADLEIIARLYIAIRDAYRAQGGRFADPIVNLNWPYRIAKEPSAEEISQEYSGYALADQPDPRDDSKIVLKAGTLLSGFGQLRDDGSTACGCWIYSGAWTPQGNQMARRDNSDPYGIGQTLNWAWAWPANRRILYNRASADPSGKPWDPNRAYLSWNGRQWSGADVADIRTDAGPDSGVNPFIMNAEGVARLFAPTGLAEGPLPEHYEPFESPMPSNPMHPNNTRAMTNPVARVFERDAHGLSASPDFPYAATTYRLTEHFHYWTKHVRLNAITQPEQFVEIGTALAEEKGIRSGDRVRVRSRRGAIDVVALVTPRLRPLNCNGTLVHHIGIPIHWGFKGLARPGFLTNTLTPAVGDANTQTPEYKSFVVNLERLGPPGR